MTTRYKKVLKSELANLNHRYAMALPIVMATGTATFLATWALPNSDYSPLTVSLISLSAALFTLAINLAYRLILLRIELHQRSKP